MIKTLAKSIREYKKYTILTPILVSIESVIDVLIPFLMAFLIDEGISQNSKEKIIIYGILLLICAFLAMLFGILAGRCAAKASTGFAKNLRKDMFYNVQNYSFSNIDKFSPASIITRHTTDITNVQMAFQMIIRIAFRAPVMLIFSLIMAFLINAKVALIFLAVMPFLAIGLYFIATNAHPVFERVFKTYDKLNNITQENIKGIRVVKSYVTEEKEINKFYKVSNDIFKDFTKAEKIVALNNPLMQISINTVIVLLSLFLTL